MLGLVTKKKIRNTLESHYMKAYKDNGESGGRFEEDYRVMCEMAALAKELGVKLNVSSK